MKSLTELRLDVYDRCASMPKDKDGYPRLMVDPFTGFVSIAHNAREERMTLLCRAIGVGLAAVCAVGIAVVWFAIG